MSAMNPNPMHILLIFQVVKSLLYSVTQFVGKHRLLSILELRAINGKVARIAISQLLNCL